MTRFAVIQTESTDGVFNGPLVPTREGITLWLRRVQDSKRRSTWGMREFLFTQSDHNALTWATREAAAKNATEGTSDWRTLAVVEVEVEVDQYGVQHLTKVA